MAKVVMYIRKNNLDKKNEGIVLMQYSHLYQQWRFNTGVKANPELFTCVFDDDTELWKLSASQQLKGSERNRAKASNEILRSLTLKIQGVILELKANSLSLMPANVEKQFHKDHSKLETPNVQKSIQDWYLEFIGEKERSIRDGINSYRSTHEHFKKFVKERGVVACHEITKQFLEELRTYLESLELSGPSIHKQFKNFRMLLNWIQQQDGNEEIKIPQAYKRFNVKARYGDPIGLTVEQFFQFYAIDLSQRPFLERTRDLFVFAVSMGGPRHGDLCRLSDALRKHGFKLEQNTITYFEGKTGNAHQEIVLNKIGLDILAKYKNVLPRVPTNQRMNTNLKEIAELLSWEEIKYIPKYDNFGKLIEVQEFPLKDIFSSKFMRKTAATIDNHLGVPTKTSMKRTGHKSFSAYSRYVDVNRESMLQANRQWDNLVSDRKWMELQTATPTYDLVTAEEVVIL